MNYNWIVDDKLKFVWAVVAEKRLVVFQTKDRPFLLEF